MNAPLHMLMFEVFSLNNYPVDHLILNIKKEMADGWLSRKTGG
jgi:hypothetical protein